MLTISALSIITPLVLLAVTPNNSHNVLNSIALLSSFITLWINLTIWSLIHNNSCFQLNITDNWIDFNSISTSWGPLHFGIDEVSIPFMLLTNLLIPICIIISWTSVNHLVNEFLLFLTTIHLLLLGVFTSLNILIFYILFEVILIPMFLIIGIWGSSKENESAAFYFFFYTLIGSLLMLLMIFNIYSFAGTLDYEILFNTCLPNNLQMWGFLGFFLSFAINVPNLPFHIWLPQAHVEAPVAGSVLLAGVLLNLGGYGFVSFSWNLFPEASSYFSPLVIILSSLAVLYASLSTCSQTDANSLIAYSSVAHMGIVTIGIFSGTLEGIVGAILLMVAHGLVSSSLFMLVTNIYESFHTSLISYYSGLSNSMPLYSTLLLIFILANIAFPLSLNFVAEFISILSAIQFHWIAVIPVLVGMVLSASYSLTLFNNIVFGQPSNFLLMSSDLTSSELHSYLPLMVPAIALGLTPFSLINSFQLPYIL